MNSEFDSAVVKEALKDYVAMNANLSFDEIKEVFDAWRDQAMKAGEKTAQLWNALLVDLREKAESKAKGIADAVQDMPTATEMLKTLKMARRVMLGNDDLGWSNRPVEMINALLAKVPTKTSEAQRERRGK